MNIFSAIRRYRAVAATVVVGLAVFALLAAGLPTAAAWLASAYVLVIAAVTAAGMIRDIRRGHWGLDILAVVAMLATVAVGEYVAALIIVLMLTGGEALEDFAAGRARSELDALLDRAPQSAHRVPSGYRTPPRTSRRDSGEGRGCPAGQTGRSWSPWTASCSALRRASTNPP